MILNFDTFQRVKSLTAGTNITLSDADGVVEISAADAPEDFSALQADVAALGGRLRTLESTSQPMLTNGPLPPGATEQILTLLVPELARIDRIHVGDGLILERSLDECWMLSAQAILGVLAVGAVDMVLNFVTFQRIKSLKAGRTSR